MSKNITDREPAVVQSPSELLDILGDEHSRTILGVASKRAVTAKELTQRCDASPSTVYRRINELLDCDLLTERVSFREDTKQTTVYETTFRHVDVDLDDGDYTVRKHACSDVTSSILCLLDELPFDDVHTELRGREVTIRLDLTQDLLDQLAGLGTGGSRNGRFSDH